MRGRRAIARTMRGAACSSNDDCLSVQEGRNRVREVAGDERSLPEQGAACGIDADHLPLRDRDDLTRTAEVHDDWRTVPWTVPIPAPFHGARVHVVRGERALIAGF